MDLAQWLALAGDIMEVAGAISIVGGSLVALLIALFKVRSCSAREVYAYFKANLARSILLGLEFLVGGDIIRTVTTTPSLTEVLVLAIIVGIRTLLSFTLQLEVEGRWPWEHRPPRGSLPAREP